MEIDRKKTDNPDFFDMRGSSMRPTLRPGEGVLIDSGIEKQKLRPGDIIIFKSPDGEYNIIHRVIRRCKYGYKSCGDNNQEADKKIVPFDAILGKALSVSRGNALIPLSGNWRGMLQFKILKLEKLCLHYPLKALLLLSGLIEKSCFLNIFHPLIKFDVVEVKKQNRKEKILIYHNKLIGRKNKKNATWKIVFPYKYFLDKNKLEY